MTIPRVKLLIEFVFQPTVFDVSSMLVVQWSSDVWSLVYTPRHKNHNAPGSVVVIDKPCGQRGQGSTKQIEAMENNNIETKTSHSKT